MKVDLYSRVSTKDQDVDQQMAVLRKECQDKGYVIASETWDMESGAIPLMKRKQFKELLDNPKGEAMLVYNLDRLSRYWFDEPVLEDYFGDCEKYTLISIKDEINLKSANGKLLFRIKFAINCNMPEDMKDKQRIGIDKALKEGRYKGRPKGCLNKKNRLTIDKVFKNNDTLLKNLAL